MVSVQTDGQGAIQELAGEMVLSPEQLTTLQQILGSFLIELQQLENQTVKLNGTIAAITGAYLAGLGLDSGLTVHLGTGKITRPLVVEVRPLVVEV